MNKVIPVVYTDLLIITPEIIAELKQIAINLFMLSLYLFFISWIIKVFFKIDLIKNIANIMQISFKILSFLKNITISFVTNSSKVLYYILIGFYYLLKSLIYPFFLIIKVFRLLESEKSLVKTGAEFLSKSKARELLHRKYKGLLIDGYKKRLTDLESFSHLALIAPTGTGKTTRYIIPNVLSLDNCSMVITDPSGEIYTKTSGYLKSKGFQIRVIDPVFPNKSLSYNPLAKITNPTDAGEISHIIVKSVNTDYDKNPFWYRGAEEVITIIINCLFNAQKSENESTEQYNISNPTNPIKAKQFLNLHNVLFVLQNFQNRPLMNTFIAINADTITFNQYNGFISGNEKTVSSFISTAINSLGMFNNSNIASLMANDGLKFEDLRSKKTALFLIIPTEKLSYYSFLINLFYTQLFQTSMNKIPDKKDLPIHCLMDEFGHCSIPNFATVITTIRKYKVSISLVLQSINQLYTKYGIHEGKTIINGGITSKLFYSGGDPETCKLVEELLGRVTEEEINKKTGTTNRREYNLLNADRIRTLPKDQAILINGSNEPILLDKVKPYFNRGIFKRKIKPSYNLSHTSISNLDYINL